MISERRPPNGQKETGFNQMNEALKKMIVKALAELSPRERAAVEVDLGMREPTDEEAKMPAEERKKIADRALSKMRKSMR